MAQVIVERANLGLLERGDPVDAFAETAAIFRRFVKQGLLRFEQPLQRCILVLCQFESILQLADFARLVCKILRYSELLV